MLVETRAKDRLTYLREAHGAALLEAVRADSRNTAALARICVEDAPTDEAALTDSLFRRYRAADPTRTGAYTQWLIRLALTGDVPVESLEKTRRALEAFDAYKRRLPAPQRDINRHRSVDSVWETVEALAVENAAASGKDEERREREAVRAESTILLEEQGWIVAIPRTQRASDWWGRGTKWCTASVNYREMFDRYNKRGPLVVFVAPDGTKHQFHAPTNFFMDALDHSAPRLEALTDAMPLIRTRLPVLSMALLADCKAPPLSRQQRLRLWFRDLLRLPRVGSSETERYAAVIGEYGLPLSSVPQDALTQPMCLDALRKGRGRLSDVPKGMRDREICLEAMRTRGDALECVPKRFLDPEIINAAIESAPDSFRHIHSYRKVLKAIKDRALWHRIVARYGDFLTAMPKDLLDRTACLLAVTNDGRMLAHVPDDFRDSEICSKAVENHASALKFVPPDLRTRALCETAVGKNGATLCYVPTEIRDNLLSLIAVEKCGRALQDVPETLRDAALCEAAVRQDGGALEFVPVPLRSEALCRMAIGRRDHRGLLRHVPRHIQTLDFCVTAVACDLSNFAHMPSEYFGYDIWRGLSEEIVAAAPQRLGEIPERWRTQEMCLKAFEAIVGKCQHEHELHSMDMLVRTFALFPKSVLTREICERMVNLHPGMLRHVPARLLDAEMCHWAVMRNDQRNLGFILSSTPIFMRTRAFYAAVAEACGGRTLLNARWQSHSLMSDPCLLTEALLADPSASRGLRFGRLWWIKEWKVALVLIRERRRRRAAITAGSAA